jgi:hypothetical protein
VSLGEDSKLRAFLILDGHLLRKIEVLLFVFQSQGMDMMRKREKESPCWIMLFVVTEAIQMLQVSPWAWFIDYGLPILFFAAIPAVALYWMATYMETIVIDSHRPRMTVPKNARQWRVISMYRYHRRQLDVLLLILYASSFLLVLETGMLLGGIQGIVIGLIVAVEMMSHLRHGMHIESRVEKKLADERRLLNGSARIFG